MQLMLKDRQNDKVVDLFLELSSEGYDLRSTRTFNQNEAFNENLSIGFFASNLSFIV